MSAGLELGADDEGLGAEFDILGAELNIFGAESEGLGAEDSFCALALASVIFSLKAGLSTVHRAGGILMESLMVMD